MVVTAARSLRKEVEMFKKIFSRINERIGEFIYRYLSKIMKDPFEDCFVKRVGDYYIFWPSSDRAQKAAEACLNDFPKKRGGFKVNEEKFDLIYEALRDEYSLCMAWFPKITLGGFIDALNRSLKKAN